MLLPLAAIASIAVLQQAPPSVKTLSANQAFDKAVTLCEQRHSGWRSWLRTPLDPHVLDLLGHAFHDDFERIRSPPIRVEELVCLRPSAEAEGDGYGILGEALLKLPTQPGRACEDGTCSGRCSRVIHPDFATASECRLLREFASSMLPPPEEEGESCFYLIDASKSTFARTLQLCVHHFAHARHLACPFAMALTHLVAILIWQSVAAMFGGRS